MQPFDPATFDPATFDPSTVDPATIALAIATGGLAIPCVGGGLLLAVALFVGIRFLQRHDQPVTVTRAVREGTRNMSRIFIRKEGKLVPMEDDPQG